MRRIELSDANHGRIMGVMDSVRQKGIREAKIARENGNDAGVERAMLATKNVHELMVLFQSAETF